MNGLLNPIFDANDELTTLLGKFLKGRVVSNTDELHLSRVKVDLGEFTEGLQKEELPFAFPLFGIRGQDFPKVDEEVVVLCASEDCSSLFYFLYPGNSEFNSQDLHGFVDNYGSLVVYNSSTGEYLFNHKDGSYIQITSDKTTIVAKNIDLKATNDISIVSQNLKLSGNTLTSEYNTSITEKTTNKNTSAAMIMDDSSNAPSADLQVELKYRNENNN